MVSVKVAHNTKITVIRRYSKKNIAPDYQPLSVILFK